MNTSETEFLPSIWDVVNNIGPGLFQVRAQVIGGGMFLADGAEIQTIATITLPLAAELGLTPAARGSLTSAVYVGVMIGSLASGTVGDFFGRKPPIVIGFGMLAVLAVASALAHNYLQLILLRALFGVAYGVGGPCWNTMAAEIVPAAWRTAMAGTSQVYFQLGEMYSIFITWLNDPMMEEIDWRWQMLMSALPAAVCLVLAVLYLDETPGFLAVGGDQMGAKAVLDRMRRFNGRESVSIEFQTPAASSEDRRTRSAWGHFNMVFGRHFLGTTLALSYSFVVINFIFYGNLYVFPQILPEVSRKHAVAPTTSMAIGVITGEIPGVLLGATLGSLLPRRVACALYASMMGVASLCFGAMVDLPHHSSSQRWALFLSFMVLRFTVNFAFVILWQYSAEVYPTVVRASGCAVAFGTGRLGAICAPPVFEHLKASMGLSKPYFILCGLMCLANLLPLPLLPETLGKNLVDTVDLDFSKAAREADGECESLLH